MKKKKLVFCFFTAWAVCTMAMAGCAGTPAPKPVQTVSALWVKAPVTADGNPSDWGQTPPVFYNQTQRAGLWLSNTDEVLCLCVTVNAPEMARRIARSGVTLGVSTQEKGANPFSVKLKGNPFLQFPGDGSQGRPERPEDRERPPKPPEPSMPGVEVQLPESVDVTYPYSSGSMTMSVKEARTNGIDLGLNATSASWCFEAVIRLDAIFFNTPVPPGSALTLTLSAKGEDRGKDPGAKMGRHDTGQRPSPGPGGGMPPGGGAPPENGGMKHGDQGFSIQVKTTLAKAD